MSNGLQETMHSLGKGEVGSSNLLGSTSSNFQCIVSANKASSGVIARAERKCRVSPDTSVTQKSLTCILYKTPIECYIQKRKR
jgi:hypothetical protein